MFVLVVRPLMSKTSSKIRCGNFKAFSVSTALLAIPVALILIAPNAYASIGSSTTTGSTSDILNPKATDTTGTTLFDAKAQALIAHCNLTNATLQTHSMM
jgi:hypothetical protein